MFDDFVQLQPSPHGNNPHSFQNPETVSGAFASFKTSLNKASLSNHSGGELVSFNATWFYRFDEHLLEVRDVDSCESDVIAQLSVDQFSQDRVQYMIKYVHYMHLGGTDYLLVGLRETQTYHYKLVLFNPLTLWYLPLNLFFEGIELSCLGSCEPLLPKDPGYVVFGSKGKFLYASYSPTSEKDIPSFSKFDMIDLEDKYATVTSIEPFSTPLTNKPAFVIGTDTGVVEFWRPDVDGVVYFEGRISLASKAPISHLTYGDGFLLVGQNGVENSFYQREESDMKLTIYNVADMNKLTIIETLDRPSSTKIVSVKFKRDKHQCLGFIILEGLDADQEVQSVLTVLALKTDFVTVLITSEVSKLVKSRILDIDMIGTSMSATVLFEDQLAVYTGNLNAPTSDKSLIQFPRFSSWFGSYSRDFPYLRPGVSQAIFASRQRMDNELMFDKLLNIIGISGPNTYPPKDILSLERLFETVKASEVIDALRKFCFIYYLLMDFSLEKASEFAEFYVIPDHFVKGISGFWYLDHGNYDQAMLIVSDPAVDVDWPHKIISAFCSAGRVDAVRKFISAFQPTQWELRDVEYTIQMFLRSNRLDLAITLHRAYLEISESQLFVSILDFCFNEKAGDGAFMNCLVGFPFTVNETTDLIQYCTERRSQSSCRNFLLTFYLYQAKYSEALQFLQQYCLSYSYPSKDQGKYLNYRSMFDSILKLLLPLQRNVFNIHAQSQQQSLPPQSPSSKTTPSAAMDATEVSMNASAPNDGEESKEARASPLWLAQSEEQSIEGQKEFLKAIMEQCGQSHSPVPDTAQSLSHSPRPGTPESVFAVSPQIASTPVTKGALFGGLMKTPGQGGSASPFVESPQILDSVLKRPSRLRESFIPSQKPSISPMPTESDEVQMETESSLLSGTIDDTFASINDVKDVQVESEDPTSITTSGSQKDDSIFKSPLPVVRKTNANALLSSSSKRVSLGTKPISSPATPPHIPFLQAPITPRTEMAQKITITPSKEATNDVYDKENIPINPHHISPIIMSKAVQSNTTPSAGPLKPSPRHVVLTSPGKAGLPDILPMLKNNSPFARTDNVASSHLMTSEKVISSQARRKLRTPPSSMMEVDTSVPKSVAKSTRRGRTGLSKQDMMQLSDSLLAQAQNGNSSIVDEDGDVIQTSTPGKAPSRSYSLRSTPARKSQTASPEESMFASEMTPSRKNIASKKQTIPANGPSTPGRRKKKEESHDLEQEQVGTPARRRKKELNLNESEAKAPRVATPLRKAGSRGNLVSQITKPEPSKPTVTHEQASTPVPEMKQTRRRGLRDPPTSILSEDTLPTTTRSGRVVRTRNK